ncbi:MAG: helix-turn-helix domain-containing protein [Clostridia bacterium]|nr:helix-turn-helix domain-containing protein [Clostridia bacterium]
MVSNFKERLIEAMSKRNMKAAELSKKSGLSKAQISQYTNGIYEAKQTALHKLAITLQVTEAWLMGHDVPMERENDIFSIEGITPIKKKRLPILGNVACGEPIYASEEFDGYISIDDTIEADFCLYAKGDSMINAGIKDGSIVLVRKQSTIENGKIAVVLINNEATLKRVYFNEKNKQLILSPENPDYQPIIIENEQLESGEVRILGKAVLCQFKIK